MVLSIALSSGSTNSVTSHYESRDEPFNNPSSFGSFSHSQTFPPSNFRLKKVEGHIRLQNDEELHEPDDLSKNGCVLV